MSSTIRILIFGGSGQLGRSLAEIAGLSSSSAFEVIVADRKVDIRKYDLIKDLMSDARPDWVVNCAAYTNVDEAEKNPQDAFDVNSFGALNLARAADSEGARVVYISSEAIFGGTQTEPYAESDAAEPVSVYGASKLSGENLTRIFSSYPLVVRTSWLFSESGTTSFPFRLRQQLEAPGDKVRVVDDIFGNPTSTQFLAETILRLVSAGVEPQTLHVCSKEVASKFDFAVALADQWGVDRKRIERAKSIDFDNRAKRPSYVNLSVSKLEELHSIFVPSWKAEIEQVFPRPISPVRGNERVSSAQLQAKSKAQRQPFDEGVADSSTSNSSVVNQTLEP